MNNEKHKITTCLELIKNNNILVLATQGEPGPHTSLMTYASSEDGTEIYMLSNKYSRKCKNISNNPSVSMLIDDRDGKLNNHRDEIKALTITGKHIPVSDYAQREQIMQLIAMVNPKIVDIFSGPDVELIRIKNTSFLLLDGPEKAFNTNKLA